MKEKGRNNHCFEKLEYHRILEILSGFAKTYVGKQFIYDLLPSFDPLEVANLQLQTSQAVDMVNQYGNPPIREFSEVALHFKKLTSDAILSTKEILDLASILKMARELSVFFEEITASTADSFVVLKPFFEHLYLNVDLEKEIFLKIPDENTIDDRASDTLYSIRKSKKALEQAIKDKLNYLIHSPTYSKYLMEPIVTIRDHRYVIPVKEEYKGQISGFIHDMSSSGSTVFIEPTSIFDMNNEMNSLKLKETIEIEKILSILTNQLSCIVTPLENNVRLIGMIDLLFAKANYAISIDGISPKINEQKKFNLIKARHPLIHKDKVVPIDISLGNTFSSLIITGPNTGGKTVALKTVGLLHLMAYCGLMIPAHEKSSIYVFDHIFADIGDEQSIAES